MLFALCRVDDGDPPGDEVSAMLEAFRRFPIKKASFVPARMHLIIQSPDCETALFKSCDTYLYGRSAITPETRRRCLHSYGCGFVHAYGASETFTFGTALTAEDHANAIPTCFAYCGRPVPEVAVRVLDDAARVCPVNVSGEITISAPSLMRGYWHLPDVAASALRDGWYHTGDIGLFDEDGCLHLRGRVSDMIISGGENIHPIEVENVLADHPDDLESAVVGASDPVWGEAVKAIIVLRAGALPKFLVSSPSAVNRSRASSAASLLFSRASSPKIQSGKR